jgi:hypothetical protein
MALAVAGEFQPRVLANFVRNFAAQVGEPGFDIAPGQEHGHAFVRSARLHALGAAGIVHPLQPFLQCRTVCIHHHDGEVLDVSRAVHTQHLWNLL